VWNVGTCRPDDKGEIQVGDTTRMRVLMRGTGADHSVVARKDSNVSGAKGVGCLALFSGQPEMGGAL